MVESKPATLYFSATNPCHLYDLCLELDARGELGGFYCGYPRRRLAPPARFPYRQIGWRTLATYALLRAPRPLRPADGRLFRWQDTGFDRAVARRLPRTGVFHGIPGQCLESFRAARARGLTTVLNHASGPVAEQMRLVEPEYRRAGIPYTPAALYPPSWLERQEAEAQLADFHCVASRLVRDQLIAGGIAPERILVVPYGARPDLFPKRTQTPSGPFRILFAGQLSIRKGLHYLLEALARSGAADWRLDCYGPLSAETEPDWKRYAGRPAIRRHGPVPQRTLAAQMAAASVLVLPSAEEAFGLVVAQALQVGLPCIVSDRVGAKDLIVEGVNGSIVPFGDPDALHAALVTWSQRPTTVPEVHDWSQPATQLLELTRALPSPDQPTFAS